MSVSPRDREVFRRIAEAESSPGALPSSFDEALDTLERLIARRSSIFGTHSAAPSAGEFEAHQALYARARTLGAHGS